MNKQNTQKSAEVKVEAMSSPAGHDKPFMEKWKEGMASIPPLNLTKIQIRSSWIMIVGILAGLVIAIINYTTIWWLGIVLAGALMNALVVLIGQYKNKYALMELDKKMAEINLRYEQNGFI